MGVFFYLYFQAFVALQEYLVSNILLKTIRLLLVMITLLSKNLILLSISLVVFSLYSVVQGADTSRQTVNVAVIGPLSGSGAVYGVKQLRGASLAAEEMNEAGSLPWHINIIEADDQGRSGLVGEIARDLVFEQNVAAFIGCVNSACTHVLEMICVKVQKPQITTVSTDPSITRAGTPWIFRCLADDRKQAKALASYISGKSGMNRVAVLTLDNRYGRMGARTCRRLLEKNGLEIVVDEVFPAGSHDRTALAERTRQSKPSVIVLWSLYSEAAQVVKSLRRAGINTPVVAPDGVTTNSFLQLAGPAAEGMIVTLPFNAFRDTENTQKFLKRYKERWGEAADSFAAHAYDGMNILGLAIKRGGVEAFAIRDNLALTSNFTGVTGQISFDTTGNDIRDVDLAIVRGGRFIPLALSYKGKNWGKD